MFKNKNAVTIVSNIILLFIFVVMLLTGISILFGNNISEAYSDVDFMYNAIMTVIYIIVTGILILLLNKKINLYKDEYPISRQVFNLIYLVMMLSIIISIFMVVVGAFVYKEFSLYTFLSLTVSLGISTAMYVFVSKGKLLSKGNTKKNNIINLIIAILFVEYVSDFLISALKLIFKTDDTLLIIKYMVVYLVGMCIVTLAYYLFQKGKIKEEVATEKEVKVIENKKGLTKNNKKDKKKG